MRQNRESEMLKIFKTFPFGGYRKMTKKYKERETERGGNVVLK